MHGEPPVLSSLVNRFRPLTHEELNDLQRHGQPVGPAYMFAAVERDASVGVPLVQGLRPSIMDEPDDLQGQSVQDGNVKRGRPGG